ncbi:membrane protein insertase YidC [Mergibacter septicus]|uniref:membrane protein insertase YidC n=1 Tax=Mergibacter septicus TaxID=221402 RepID=UPI001178FE59|nr:membrane protein insertase YidC [Mergibacter septicus]AWX14459.1 membrane protein insertase YidC [Mergibacter septicus]
MNSQRSLLVITLLFISFLIYQQWEIDNNPPPVTSPTQSQTHHSALPPSSQAENYAVKVKGKVVSLQSDVLHLDIDTVGGDVIQADLLKYPDELHSKQPFKLLQDNKELIYIAQSGLVGKNGSDSVDGRAIYQTNDEHFVLQEGQDQLVVPFTYQKDGVTYRKIFTLKRGSYDVQVNFEVTNNSGETIEVQPYGKLTHTAVEDTSHVIMPTYTGGAYSSQETTYKKYKFEEMVKDNLSINTKQGWVAVLQHYFVSAWVPDQTVENHLYTQSYANDNLVSIGYRGPVTQIANDSTKTLTSQLWLGPKLQQQMEKVADNLDLTIDYGWAWFIAKPLFLLLQFIHSLVHNWGLAVIGVTIVVKALLYPLTKAQYTSMAKMRMLQPKIQEMRERFGEDRQRMSQEMMELYKKEKVNPLGGCLPILLQMPIFIALYWTFLEAVELRQAPFFGWIQDLAAPDPYYILPILMGASMFLLQKMSPTPVADPIQQKVMLLMPVIFTFFFLNFPSGLVLYWLASNIITIVQQQLIYRGLEKKGLHSRQKK